ncbi:hypothetical protein BW685_07080 [Burkholderia ubonensis]|uniref:Uncharacterized protein n=1 Tax=Burkholderia ubonensis TaxID=101571 RepID=A0A1R1JG86_9BURK|nr:hypothetical protein BW685_07080 [Burkholderia ubonensis]
MLPPSRKLLLLGRYSAGDRATPCRAPAAGTGANFDSVHQKLLRNHSFIREKICPALPDCTATLRPRMR